ncbi:MAG: coproporphyrinogen-III oxidase family protein [Methylacidiphilales bacterium]|nr:coproporphyrinogen-III oxidase family protein [Candidatus Methylacidiphilales bacterium]
MTSPTTAKHHATRAGNYFVANYPPFSFWKPENVGDVQAALGRPPAPGNPLGLYVHIPFCRKRCHFCYFKVYTEQNAARVQQYIDAAVAELKIYAGKPFIGGRHPDFVYFGGGTPSYLSVKQLTDLTGRLKALLPWDAVQEVAFECEPGTLTEPKLQAIKDMGVTRLSLGVENFDDHILEINGRAHHSQEIERAYGFARTIGFNQINIDLIAGMVEETEANWLKCVEKVVAMSPESVTIYQMEIPYNTTIYKEMKAEGKLVAPVADWETKRGWVEYAFAELERAGYTIASAYTAVKDPTHTKFLYRDRLWEGADLLPIGVASFGHINGVHFQNEHDIVPYLDKVSRGELPLWRALAPNAEERLIREMVLQMKLGHISRKYFRNKFGVDVAERFASPLRQLESEGFLDINGDTIRYSRAGLLQVDTLLHDFFLPQHRDARYA